MKRKLIALILACSMLTAMVGCGSKEVDEVAKESTEKQESSTTVVTSEVEEESTGIVFPLEEPIEISIVSCPGNSPYYLENTWIMQWMEEQTNVKINVTNIQHSEMKEKRNLMLNSGDYPDVFLKANLWQTVELGQEGILIDMTDLLKEYAPNYCALLDKENAWDTVISTDGKIYALSELKRAGILGAPMYINQKWLDNLGLKMPTSAEELYDVLKAFRDKDADGNGNTNDEIPMLLGSADLTPVEHFWNYFGINHRDWTDHFELTDEGKIRYFPATEEYKEITAYLTKLYAEKLINQDTFTLTNEQAIALLQSGSSVGAFFAWSNAIGEDYVPVYPFEQNDGKLGNSKGYTYGVFSITDKCEYPEIVTAWMDLLFSYEGSMISKYGFEGEQYEVVDGKAKWIGEWNSQTVAPYRLVMGGTCSIPVNNIDTLDSYVDPVAEPLNYQKQEFTDSLVEQGLLFDAWPTMTFTSEEEERNTAVLAETAPYFKNYRAQVITGEIDLESTWDEYVKTLEKMGIRDVEANYNACYERATQ